MSSVLIIIAAAITIVFIAFLFSQTQNKSRKKEYKDWEIDDLLITDAIEMRKRNLEFENGYTYAILKGWDENNVYIDICGNSVHQTDWDVIKLNKSAKWRRNYANCEKAMGKRPAFSPKLKHHKSLSNLDDKVDGKPIELLNETECQVYLTQAITDENYELAEKLRKRLEKFR